VNKFFTLALGVILVLVGKGIVLGQMTTETTPQPSLIPVTTTTSSGLPKPLDLSRFEALGKKSPFTMASATAEADFAKELFLGGYVRVDGEDFVIVANKTKPDRIFVGRKPSPAAQGMVLLDLKKDPSGNPSKLEARIKKGTEMATLGYLRQDTVNPPVASVPGAAPTPPPFLNMSGQQSGQAQGNFQGKAMGIPPTIISRPVITPPLPK
jgi:hypothetical protein